MFNPFRWFILHKFIDYLESNLLHPIKLIFLNNNNHIDYFNSKNGWETLYSGEIRKVFAMKIWKKPIKWAMYSYTPPTLKN